jgi:hypothetical protein
MQLSKSEKRCFTDWRIGEYTYVLKKPDGSYVHTIGMGCPGSLLLFGEEEEARRYADECGIDAVISTALFGD